MALNFCRTLYIIKVSNNLQDTSNTLTIWHIFLRPKKTLSPFLMIDSCMDLLNLPLLSKLSPCFTLPIKIYQLQRSLKNIIFQCYSKISLDIHLQIILRYLKCQNSFKRVCQSNFPTKSIYRSLALDGILFSCVLNTDISAKSRKRWLGDSHQTCKSQTTTGYRLHLGLQ